MPHVKCESCGKEINPDVFYCPFCGARQSDTVNDKEALCPRCGAVLEPVAENGMEIDICPSCGGLWLDRSEFHVMTAESTVYREFKLESEYMRPPHQADKQYVKCVRCGKLMTKKNFGKVSGVIIDECGRHGVWLDGGELEKIRHFIADGGLERSQDREIEKNRLAIADIAATAKGTAFTLKMLHFFNFKRWLFG